MLHFHLQHFSENTFSLAIILAPNTHPYYVSYVNRLTSWWPPEKIAESIGANNSKGCNIINLSFWWPTQDGSSDPKDAALVWSNALHYLTSGYGRTTREIQANLRNLYHEQNTKVLVSAFGDNSLPTTSEIDPSAVGRNLAMFVINNQLDGVDIDYEDSAAMEAGTAVPWLIEMTESMLQTFRVEEPNSKFIISHAPQAPYFMSGNYPQNYLAFYNSKIGNDTVGDYIDFFNVQFYNQGSSDYSSYETLFVQANGWAKNTTVAQIAALGIPMNKIVVGKPVTQADVSNTGYIAKETLAGIFTTARQGVWSDCSNVGGVMNWQFSSDEEGWMESMKHAISCR